MWLWFCARYPQCADAVFAVCCRRSRCSGEVAAIRQSAPAKESRCKVKQCYHTYTYNTPVCESLLPSSWYIFPPVMVLEGLHFCNIMDAPNMDITSHRTSSVQGIVFTYSGCAVPDMVIIYLFCWFFFPSKFPHMFYLINIPQHTFLELDVKATSFSAVHTNWTEWIAIELHKQLVFKPWNWHTFYKYKYSIGRCSG